MKTCQSNLKSNEVKATTLTKLEIKLEDKATKN